MVPHAGLGRLEALLGTWSGAGEGVYPTIDSFRYVETVTFGHVGKPFLVYEQRTRAIVDGSPAHPLHAEAGYWRCVGDGRVELVVSHPTGIGEIEEGVADITSDGALEIELRSVAITRSSTAKSVTELRRTYRLDGDTLEYRIAMAAVGHPLQHHLAASLQRVPDGGSPP